MEGAIPHHAVVPTVLPLRQQQQQQQQQQQKFQRQKQQQLSLQLQHQMDTLQHQINNMHLEFDVTNRNNVVGVHMTAPRKNIKQHQYQHHGHPHTLHHHQHQQHQQQHHTASPMSMSSSSSSSMTSGNTSARPCGRRHILPRYPDPDPDAIEICNDEQEKHMNGKVQQQFYQIENDMANLALEDGDNLPSWDRSATLHSGHDYSYAYYEPGVPMRHSNIPAAATTPPPNSIRALLSKGKKNKLLVSAATRQSYQSRYKMRNNGGECCHASIMQQHNTLPSHGHASMLHENFYEEISSTETIEVSPPASQVRPSATYHSAGSLNQSLVEEELRRVQTRHRKILGELNLSVEVMLMPKSPPLALNSSSSVQQQQEEEEEEEESKVVNNEQTPVSIANISDELPKGLRMGGSMRLNSAASADNISATTTVVNAEGQSIITHGNNNNINTQSGFCAADLDSGFSGSSGASYIGSLRLQKTNAALSQLRYARQTMQNGNEHAGKCTFPYATQSCRNFHNTGWVATNGCAGVTKVPSSSILPAMADDVNDSGFFIRSPCGRVLNCAKIRAVAEAGQATGPPTESIARTFWHRKGWRKLPGLSNSTSSINNTGLATTNSTPKLLQPFVSSYIYLKRSTTFRKT